MGFNLILSGKICNNEVKCQFRSEFDRDRDRILYSRAFRRLSGKTQVFLSGKDDHIRNRLSHTLEVAQIARTIAKGIGLNEELTEAIALSHDIGHTPFGHVGERTLNYIMCGCDKIKDFTGCLQGKKGFKHNWQGIRVVTELENKSKDYKGLNLTNYTLWGLLNHSSLKFKECKCNFSDNDNKVCTLRRRGEGCNNGFELTYYDQYKTSVNNNKSVTVEGLIVAVADEIAQRHHDVEDALEARVINYEDLLNKIIECYGEFTKDQKVNNIRAIKSNETDMDIKRIMLSSFIVDVLTQNVIEGVEKTLESYINLYCINTSKDFEKKKENDDFVKVIIKGINFTDELINKDKIFKEFIWNRILHSHKAQSMDGKGNYIIRQLFKAYVTNPQQLPDKTVIKLFDNLDNGIIKKYHQTEKLSHLEIVGKLRDELNDKHSKNDSSYKEALLRTICDYISGMTDKYAMDLYSELYENRM